MMSVDSEDSRIHALRRKIMTEFLRDLRATLNEIQAKKGSNPLPISASTFTEKRNKSGQLVDFCKTATEWYANGAAGIAVWDPENGAGFRQNAAEGDSMDLLR